MLGDDLSAITAGLMETFGDTTQIGDQTFAAFWDEAQPGRAQQYLKENEWAVAAYEVQLPAAARPYLRDGKEVLRVKDGLKTVVRHPDLPGMQDTDLLVYALVTVIPRK